ncbi:MAG: recombination-associated protein RdgC [Candidatus Contendobacter odensis]|uniref:Recombination-associated protein RdgC n=1 Tax=Candidatus Contendibacter odensensis TaxID=1400860 RepID=A0A2G6PF82_9GAMM|nr:MAG: recombination-associated protein RdgC [Candidatus Contendobacter odensis]
MLFNNLTLFQLSEPWSLTAEALATRLESCAFQPCPGYQFSSSGWVPPLGRGAVDLVHAAMVCMLVCLRTEEKVLPPVVINQIMAERIAVLEEQQQGPVRRRARQELREQIIQELLPRALNRSRDSFAYIDPLNQWVVVNSASPRAVEEITAAIRKAVGTLPIVPVQAQRSPAAVMTAWLAEGSAPQGFAFGDMCELHETGEGGGVVRCRGQDLRGDELQGHLRAGKQVVRLGLIWDDRLAFVLDESLVIRHLRFLDVVQESLKTVDTDSAAAIFDAEFALMSGELARLIPRLLGIFGGQA